MSDNTGKKTKTIRTCLRKLCARLSGKFCRILRQTPLPGESPPAVVFLVFVKIMLGNPHTQLAKTGSIIIFKVE